MKKQILPQKLTFIKKTIAHLNSEEMNSANGGTDSGWITANGCINSYSLDLSCQI